MNLIKKLWLTCLFVASTLAINYNVQGAASTYGVSCTNTSYGTQLGGVYLGAGVLTTLNGQGNTYGMYTSTDCVYGGAGRTNSSAIVGGEIARAAANAIVGSVTNRINSVLAMSANPDTAAHMSYSADGSGIGMAANHIVGGLGAWVSYSSSSFDNDQTFSNLSTDSNNFDGSADAMSFGIDKTFGNMLVGINMTSFTSDIDTLANGGTIDTEGETYGLYFGINTGALSLSAGGGTGEYEIDTNRKDLGTGNLGIKGTDITADIQYYFVNASATLSRGKLSFTPRVGYRNFDLDMPAFTDIVPDVAASTNLGAAIDSTNADEAIGGKTYSSDMTEAGLSIALSAGAKLIPYIDVAYVSEDTTKASYATELSTDGVAELNASAPDGYVTYGGGLVLNLSSKVNGYLNFQETTSRDDFNETTISGNLRIKF